MRKYLIRLACLVLVAGGAIYGAVRYIHKDSTDWPDFSQVAAPTDSSLAPLTVVRAERDYGWRTADLIDVDVFVMQQPGTRVDPYSLATEGDFQIVSEPQYEIVENEDGSALIRVSLRIQSMAVKDQLMLRVLMLYRDLDTREDFLFASPDYQPFTSMTWDGRDVIQDGDPTVDNTEHLTTTTLYVGLGLLGMILCFVVFRRLKPVDPDADASLRGWRLRREIARQRFDEVWARFLDGDYSEENYREISRIVRDLFLVRTKGYREIYFEMGDSHPYRRQAMDILILCGMVLYRDRILSRDEHFGIKTRFDQIMDGIPAKRTVKKKKTGDAAKSRMRRRKRRVTG